MKEVVSVIFVIVACVWLAVWGIIIEQQTTTEQTASEQTEWEQKGWERIAEFKLVTLHNSVETVGSGFIYLSVSADLVYTYRYEVESEFGTSTSKEYETDCVKGNVVEVEDPNCTVPVLTIYQKELGMFENPEKKYVFHVPEGTIFKEVKLD